VRKLPFVLVIGVVSALVVAGAGVARTQATSVRVAATLAAANETPTPKGNVAAAQGAFSGTLTKSATGAALSWKLEFSGLSANASAAHIHTGAPGKAGPVVVPLCAPCSSGASGTATITPAVLDAIQSGGAYVNVHTSTNPAGEIRGQLAITDGVRVTLNEGQARPRPKGKIARATGLFSATVTRLGSEGTITWRLTFSGLTGRAFAAHIHSGPRNKSGPVIVSLCSPCKSGASGRANVDESVLKALESGKTYVNVHTRKNPAGEIRGQIRPVALTLS
jgi:Cu/Zn superoxide dismutase